MTKQFYSVTATTLDTEFNKYTDSLVFSLGGRAVNRKGYAFKDCTKNTYILMQQASCISAYYSRKESIFLDWARESKPIEDGDYIFVDGQLFTVVINGDYSNAGRLELVEDGMSREEFVERLILTMAEKHGKEALITDFDRSIMNDAFINAVLDFNEMTMDEIVDQKLSA